MPDLSHFRKYIGKHFLVSIDGDTIDTLVLVRADPLPPPPAEYTTVRQDPFEMLFRSSSDLRIETTVTLTDEDGNKYEIYLNPECYYDCPDKGDKVVQYHCMYT